MSQPDLLALAGEEAPLVVPIAASQSLYASTDTASAAPGAVPTGLQSLDEALCPTAIEEDSGLSSISSTPQASVSRKGLCCGQVTEVYGPPGVGKTSLALCATANALRDGRKVVWIDTMSPLPSPRLKRMLRKALDSTDRTDTSEEDLIQNLIYFRAPSLPHLLALLLRPPKDVFPPDNTALLVVDSVSALFPSYLPNPTELRARFTQSNITDRSQTQWLMNRRWNITSDLASQLMKLATTRRLAVLVTNQTHTKIKGHPRATLCPVLTGGSWESNISTRIVLYRDFSVALDDEMNPQVLTNVRLAEVMKRSGRTLALRLEENIIPFVAESDGLRVVEKKPSTTTQEPEPRGLSSQAVNQPASEPASQSASQRKRKVDEIADSQDEDDDSDGDYGWAEGDDADLLEKPRSQ